MFSEKEEQGYTALKNYCTTPLLTQEAIIVLYPGSGERIEHINRMVSILCHHPKKILVHMVDPLMNLQVLRKKVEEYPLITVHAHVQEFSVTHIPKFLTLYFERAFEIFRTPFLIDRVIQQMESGGLFISDATIHHPLLNKIILPVETKNIGFYPDFGVYQKKIKK